MTREQLERAILAFLIAGMGALNLNGAGDAHQAVIGADAGAQYRELKLLRAVRATRKVCSGQRLIEVNPGDIVPPLPMLKNHTGGAK